MAITYPITFPTTFGVSDFNIGIVHAVGSAESIFTYEEQVQVHQGEKWDISFSINLLSRDNAEEYNTFILKLRGKTGTFLFTPPGQETTRGTFTGTLQVSGSNQTGEELVVQGLGASATNELKQGDFIQLGTGASSRLHKILDTPTSNGSGLATLNIAPKIVTAPSNGSTVVYENPQGLFRSKVNFSPVNIKPPNQQTIQFSARSVI